MSPTGEAQADSIVEVETPAPPLVETPAPPIAEAVGVRKVYNTGQLRVAALNGVDLSLAAASWSR